MIFAVASTGGGGGGTVTTVSAGNLSPLFTTIVSTPTTSPSIAFTLVSQAANLVYASPNGGAGVPTFRALVAADLPTPAIPITATYIPQGTGTSITDGTWAFSTNDIYPLTTGSNIGDATHRIGTIFMASTFDYASDLNWYNGTVNTMTLLTTGNLGINTPAPLYKLHLTLSASGDALYIANAGKHLFINPNGISTGCDIETDNFMNLTAGGGSFRLNGSSDIKLYGIAGTNTLYLTADAGSSKGLYLYNINGDATVINAGFNTSTPSASVHIVGSGSPTADYALKVDYTTTPLLYVRNDGNVYVPNFFTDGSSVNSFSPYNRKLYNTAGLSNIDYENGYLQVGGTTYFDWSVGKFYVGGGTIATNLAAYQLVQGTNTRLDWNTDELLDANGGGVVSLNWNDRNTKNTGGTQTVFNWNTIFDRKVAEADNSIPFVVATNAGSTTIGDTDGGVILDPAGLIATYTVTMPASPIDGQLEVIAAGGFGVTALTLSPNTGQSFATGAAITTLAASGFAKYKFKSGTNVWYRIG